MMSALEREIIEKFRQLQPAARQRIRALIEQETASEIEQTDEAAFDYDAWFRDIEILRQKIRTSHGDKLPPMDVVGILRDIRDGEDE
jgi:hypothetical protein